MASTHRRQIGPAPVGAQTAPANDKAPKAEDAAPAAQDAPAAQEAPPEAPPAEPVIEPVDTESADYKAGYQNAIDGVDAQSSDYKAGYAAGLGAKGAEGGSAESEPAPAESAAAASAAKPATVAQLRALAPDDNGFVVDCLGENMTLDAATAKYAAVLREKLKTANAARTEAERKLAAETSSPAPVRMNGGKQANANNPSPAAEEAPDDPKAAAAKEWDDNPAVRRGFSSKASYVSVRAAQLAGTLRIMAVGNTNSN